MRWLILGAYVCGDDADATVTEALRQSGLTPSVDEFKSSAHMDKHPKQVQASIYARALNGQFEAAIVPLGFGPSSLDSFFGGGSRIAYKNAAVASLIDRLQASLDPDARDAIYRELPAIFRSDVPVTFLCPEVVTYVVHRRLQGLSSPWRADPVPYMEDLWLDASDQAQ